MAVVISNRGRLISDLTSVANLNNDDLFIIQSVNASTNSTRKATISQLSQKVLGSLSSYSTTVKFSSTGNEFTGAFYNANGNTSNLYDVTIRNSLSIGTGVTATISPTNLTFSPVNGALFTKKITNTIGGITGSASTGFTGSLKGKLTGPVTGSVKGNVVGNLTGNVVGNVTGNISGNVTGNVSGNVTGDIYSPISQLVLQNGTGLAKNALFYGTSSYAIQALTAAYAVSSATSITAAEARSYVTTSMNSGGGVANTLPKFSGTSQLGLSSINDNGTSVSISTALTVATKIIANSLTGSIYGAITSPPSEAFITAASTYTIDGDGGPSSVLHVSSSGATVSLNLRKGKTCTILIKNGGAYSISAWNASINGGVSTTSIYWKNGSAPAITSGLGKKDVFTFVNINNYVLGSSVQNFS